MSSDETIPADVIQRNELVTERALAARWNKSIRTMQRLRSCGAGPAYFVIGRSVFYLTADIADFEQTARRGGGSK